MMMIKETTKKLNIFNVIKKWLETVTAFFNNNKKDMKKTSFFKINQTKKPE